MPAKTQTVTLAPPIRSASQPPNGRDIEPTSAPRNASFTPATPATAASGNWVLISSGNAAEYPMKEPNVPMYSTAISQVWGRRATTSWERSEALATVRLSMKNQAQTAESRISGTQSRAAFCRYIGSPPALPAWAAPITPMASTSGTNSCAAATPRLPPAALRPSARPLRLSGKKKEMFAMLEEKLPPPRPANAAATMNTQ